MVLVAYSKHPHPSPLPRRERGYAPVTFKWERYSLVGGRLWIPAFAGMTNERRWSSHLFNEHEDQDGNWRVKRMVWDIVVGGLLCCMGWSIGGWELGREDLIVDVG